MKKFIENDLIKALSAIELMGITVTIIAAFYFQFAIDELPCPLCLLLQRLRAISNWIWFFYLTFVLIYVLAIMHYHY